jgi:hypothetical protein
MMTRVLDNPWQEPWLTVWQMWILGDSDSGQTVHDVCESVELLYGTCQKNLSHELNMQCIAVKFVPRPWGKWPVHIALCSEPVKWCSNSWALRHDIRRHSLCGSFQLQQKLQSSPHLPPTLLTSFNLFLFPEMKLNLRGWCFESIKEIQAELRDVKLVMGNDYYQCFWSWKSPWNQYIRTGGDYYKGDGGEYKFR